MLQFKLKVSFEVFYFLCRLSGCSQLEKLRDELQSCKMKLSAAEDAEQSLSLVMLDWI